MAKIEKILNKLNSNTSSSLKYRPFDIQDMNLLNSIFKDEQVMKVDGVLRDDEWIKNWITTQTSSYQLNGFGHLALFSKKDEKFLGYCGLLVNQDISKDKEIEIGYRIVFNYWGKGIATEAAKSILESAHTILNIKRIVAVIEPNNIGSLKVASKLGFKYQREIMFDWYDHPDHLYVKEY